MGESKALLPQICDGLRLGAPGAGRLFRLAGDGGWWYVCAAFAAGLRVLVHGYLA
jgi:hypothetical protein